jgi:GTP-binding protein
MGDHAPRGRCLIARVVRETGVSEPDTFPPRAADPDLVEAGRRLFAREIRFVAGAAGRATLPPDRLPEIAFAGRSNVGKSSLVNALTGRRTLARTSNTPGRTRQINFFALDGRLMLVDLPGYGYAEASKTEVRRWTDLLRHYLRWRASLRRVCLLVDARHGIKEADRPMMDMLDDSGVSYQLVLTKTDKLRAHEVTPIAGRVLAELATHPAAHPEIYVTSAVKRYGLEALRATLGSFALFTATPAAVAAPVRAE